MAFVLDASIALAWCFVDEKTAFTEHLLEQLSTEKEIVCVPEIWSLEIANILIAAERRKRISYAQVMLCLDLLQNLPITIDRETSQHAFHETIALSYSEKLSTYDAAYLELALRRGIPLASKDMALCKAAERLGVKVLC